MSGFKVWSAGDVLAAAEVNSYLMRQAISVFTNDTARSSAIGTPVTGQFTYLTSTNKLEYWGGTAWQAFSAGGGGGISEFLLMGA